MDLAELKNKKVAVLGFGSEGQAVVDYLLKNGIRPTLLDEAPPDEWEQDRFNKLNSLDLKTSFGPDAFKNLVNFDVAFRSPGIRHRSLELIAAEQQGVTITSQVNWFFEHCRAKIIGVTGTKGKGTTAALITEILNAGVRQRGGNKVYLTGNIDGIQPLEFLDALTEKDIIIYELSSFQLQDLHKSPTLAIVLMITAEHLDYHKNLVEYHESKIPIVKYQTASDIAIINIDYPASSALAKIGQGQKVFVSKHHPVEVGCYINGDDFKISGVTNTNLANNELTIHTGALKLKGKHNLENAAAAILASLYIGATVQEIEQGLSKFKGLPHRLQLVARRGGVSFYDDSIATTPDSAVAAITSFTEPLIIILGGSDKQVDMAELGLAIAAKTNIKAVILLGETAGKIKQAIVAAGEFNGSIIEGASSMPEVFLEINKIAKPGDTVLLSPASASFDMFKNYKERGKQFTNLAKAFSLKI